MVESLIEWLAIPNNDMIAILVIALVVVGIGSSIIVRESMAVADREVEIRQSILDDIRKSERDGTLTDEDLRMAKFFSDALDRSRYVL